MESFPQTYIPPPTMIKAVNITSFMKDLNENIEEYVPEKSTIIVDTLSYLRLTPQTILELHELAALRKCSLVTTLNCTLSAMEEILRNESEVQI